MQEHKMQAIFLNTINLSKVEYVSDKQASFWCTQNRGLNGFVVV